MLDPRTFSAQLCARLAPRATRARVALMAVTVIIVFLLAALLLDAPASTAARNWPQIERQFFAAITRLGKSDWILIPTALVFVLTQLVLLRSMPRQWRWATRGVSLIAGYVFVAVAVPGIVTVIIKRIVGRARPYLADDATLSFEPFNLVESGWHSFPSGHATVAIAFAIALITLTNRRFRWVFLLFAALISLSRIVLGDHYLTDIAGGLIVGTVTGVLVRDYFATRGWGMQIENGQVVSRLHRMFVPLWRRLRAQRRAR